MGVDCGRGPGVSQEAYERMQKPKAPENVIVIHNDLFGWLRGFPWFVTSSAYQWAVAGWRRAAAHHEEAKRELAEVSNRLHSLERIYEGKLVDESHIEWREDEVAKGMNFPFDSFMRAHCAHCGKQRGGIEVEYKGKRYFKPCYDCHCDAVCQAFSMAEAIIG